MLEMCRTRSQTLKQLSEELKERERQGISWSNAELELAALTQLGSVSTVIPDVGDGRASGLL